MLLDSSRLSLEKYVPGEKIQLKFLVVFFCALSCVYTGIVYPLSSIFLIYFSN